MDLRLAILVLGSLQFQLSAANDPFWVLFNHVIEVRDGYGVRNATKDVEDSNSNTLQWNFANEIGQRQMIRLKFLLQGNSDMLTLDINGIETFIATGVSCYHFTRSGQTDPQCEITATQSGCRFVNLTTTHLNLFYSGLVKPQFIFEYVYTDCSGNRLHSITMTTTTTKETTAPISLPPTQPSFGRSLVVDSGRIPFDFATEESEPTTVRTPKIVRSRNIGVTAPNLPTGNTLLSGETTQLFEASDSMDATGQSGRISSTLIIIIVLIVVIALIIVSATGWRCAKRMRSKSTRQSAITSSIPVPFSTDAYETTLEDATPSIEPHTSTARHQIEREDYMTPDVFPDEGDYEEPDGVTLHSGKRLPEAPGYQTVASLPGDHALYTAYDVTHASKTNTYANTALVAPQTNEERNAAFRDGLTQLQESSGYQTVEMLPGNRMDYSDCDNTDIQQNHAYESIA